MAITVAEIVRRVKSAIDELTQEGTDFSDLTNDVANMTQIIVDKIGYGLTFILENAPLDKLDSSMFEQTSPAGSIVSGTGAEKAQVSDDVIRVVSARLSSWTYAPVPVPESSQVALMQSDEYAKGSWDRPVSVLTFENNNRYLYMYSPKTNSVETCYMTVVKKPDVSGISVSNLSASVNVPSRLEAALVYQVAGLTMLAYREDVAQSLFNVARNYLSAEVSEG